MADELAGKWVLQTTDNYDGVLKELGVNLIKRQMAIRLPAHIEIEKKSETRFKQKYSQGPVTKEREFEVDEEFEDQSPIGEPLKGSWKRVDGALVGTFNYPQSGRVMVVTRKVESGIFIEITECGKAKAIRKFKRKS